MEPDRVLFLDISPTALSEGATPTSEIAVAKLGSFKDSRYGNFEITLQDFNTWIKNFQTVKPEVQLDQDHESEDNDGKTHSCGWIKSLRIQGKYLMAKVEWTSLGVELVQGKVYRFISPCYRRYTDEQGKVTPNVLTSVALTNRPFLRQDMPAVSLSAAVDEAIETLSSTALEESGETGPGASDSRAQMKELLKKLTDALGLDESADESKVLETITGLKDAKSLSKVAEALGLEADADEAKVLTAAKEAKEAGSEDDAKSLEQRAKDEGKVVLTSSTYEALKTGADAGIAAAKELTDMRFDSAYKTALDEGRVDSKDETKAEWRQLFDVNEDVTLSRLAAAAPLVSTKPRGVTGSPGDAPANVDPERHELHVKVLDYQKEHPEADYMTALNAVEDAEGVTV